MKLCIAVFAFVVCSLVRTCDTIRVPRKAGDQAPTGKCETFKWGGVTGLHWYACCNNCNDTNSTCDGKTYQSASTTKYCNSCGVDNKKGNGKKDSILFCGGCSGQNEVQEVCTSDLKKVFNIPGFCWAFVKCFKRKCKKRYGYSLEPTEDEIPDTCFDLVCEPGEDVFNCPTDCCGVVNDQCKWEKYQNDTDTCPKPCCGESSCCLGSGGQGVTKQPLLWPFIIALLPMLYFPNNKV